MPGFGPGMSVLETLVIPFHHIPNWINFNRFLGWKGKWSDLFQFGYFAVFRVLAAAAAIFWHSQLVGGVDLVFFRSVILRFTHRADESDILARSFFGHRTIIQKSPRNCEGRFLRLCSKLQSRTFAWSFGRCDWLIYNWRGHRRRGIANYGLGCCHIGYRLVFRAALLTYPDGFAVVSGHSLAISTFDLWLIVYRNHLLWFTLS